MEITTEVILDKKYFDKLYLNLFNEQTMLEFHKEWDRMMSPYVPWKEGVLDEGLKVIKPDGIEYWADYAHYQYFLHKMEDDLAGTTNRTRTHHKRPTSFWDVAFMNEKGDEFIAQLQDILDRKIKERNADNGS